MKIMKLRKGNYIMTKTTQSDLLYIEDVKERNFILYAKNGELRKEKIPEYGTVTFTYQNGKFVMLEKRSTKK